MAFNPETGTTTQGETVEEALLNLREATELYLEEFPLSMVLGIPDEFECMQPELVSMLKSRAPKYVRL